MTIVRLPIDATDSHFRFTTELDGITYGFEFRWNHRLEQWKMAVYDGDGKALAEGIAVVTGFSLLSRFRSYGTLPAGDLLAVDTAPSGPPVDPGFADLGRRFVLYYSS